MQKFFKTDTVDNRNVVCNDYIPPMLIVMLIDYQQFGRLSALIEITC